VANAASSCCQPSQQQVSLLAAHQGSIDLLPDCEKLLFQVSPLIQGTELEKDASFNQFHKYSL
jgi:hypothetical protein